MPTGAVIEATHDHRPRDVVAPEQAYAGDEEVSGAHVNAAMAIEFPLLVDIRGRVVVGTYQRWQRQRLDQTADSGLELFKRAVELDGTHWSLDRNHKRVDARLRRARVVELHSGYLRTAVMGPAV